MDLSFFARKRVFITGHTGFLGTWLSHILAQAGADVTGFSLAIPAVPNVFEIARTQEKIISAVGDVRDFGALQAAFGAVRPEFIIHLAAQPLVQLAKTSPAFTFETNVMGTVNILEAMRQLGGQRSFVAASTDNVYKNQNWDWQYRENDTLDGQDPLSNSKSCAELAIGSYRRAYFNTRPPVAVSTLRMGSLLGGGDFSLEHFVPHCINGFAQGQAVYVPDPYARRPRQHVLEAAFAILLLLKNQYEYPDLAGSYNLAPDSEDVIANGELATTLCRIWGGNASWEGPAKPGVQVTDWLDLDNNRIKKSLGWRPVWDTRMASEKTLEWSKAYIAGEDVCQLMQLQIQEYNNSFAIYRL